MCVCLRARVPVYVGVCVCVTVGLSSDHFKIPTSVADVLQLHTRAAARLKMWLI